MSVKWKVEGLDVEPELLGKENVVTNVHWRAELFMASGDRQYSTSAYGCIRLTFDNQNQFIDFNALTEDIVVDWVKFALNSHEGNQDVVQQIEDGLFDEIRKTINSINSKKKLPWSK